MKKMCFLAFFILCLLSAPMTVWGATYEYKCAPTNVTVTDQTSESAYKYKLTIALKLQGGKTTTLYVVLQPASHKLEGKYQSYSSSPTRPYIDATQGTSGTYIKLDDHSRFLKTSKTSSFTIIKVAEGKYELRDGTLYFQSTFDDYTLSFCYSQDDFTQNHPFSFDYTPNAEEKKESSVARTYTMNSITNFSAKKITNGYNITFNAVGNSSFDQLNYDYDVQLQLVSTTDTYEGTFDCFKDINTAYTLNQNNSTIKWTNPSNGNITTRNPIDFYKTSITITRVAGNNYVLSGVLYGAQSKTSSTPYSYDFGDGVAVSPCTLSDEVDNNDFVSMLEQCSAPVNITLDRSLSASNYNTFCSPVGGEVETLLGAGAEVYEFAGTTNEGNNYTFTFSELEGDNIEAGVPYLVKPSSDIAQIELTNVPTSQLTTEAQTITHNGFSFCGVLAPTQLSGSEYVLGDGDLLYKALPGQMKGMRAYFTFPTSQNGVAPRVSVKVLNQTDTPTNWEAVHSVPKTQKMLRNGRLLIHRDGKTYDILGNKQ